MPSEKYLRLEKQVAHAHRVIWQASDRAEHLGLLGLQHDLAQINAELMRIQESLLGSGRSLRRQVAS